MTPAHNNPHSSGVSRSEFPVDSSIGDAASIQAQAQNRSDVCQPGRPSALQDGRAGSPRAGGYRPYGGSPLQRLLEQPPVRRGTNAMMVPLPGLPRPHPEEGPGGLGLLPPMEEAGAQGQDPRASALSQLLGVQHVLIDTLYRNEQRLTTELRDSRRNELLITNQLREFDRRMRQMQAEMSELTTVSAEQESSLRGYRNWNYSLCLSMQAMENELTELRAQSSSASTTQPPTTPPPAKRARLSSPVEEPRPVPGTWVPSQLSPDSTVRLPVQAHPRDEGSH